MKEIGLMGNMMDMEWKHGLEGAGIEDSIGRVLDMVLECIGFIQGMYMQASGLMGRAMVVGNILARMVADMLVNSSGALSMGLVTTILGNFMTSLYKFCYLMRIFFVYKISFGIVGLSWNHFMLVLYMFLMVFVGFDPVIGLWYLDYANTQLFSLFGHL